MKCIRLFGMVQYAMFVKINTSMSVIGEDQSCKDVFLLTLCEYFCRSTLFYRQKYRYLSIFSLCGNMSLKYVYIEILTNIWFPSV